MGHGVEVELAEAAPRVADPQSVNASQKLGFKELAQIVWNSEPNNGSALILSVPHRLPMRHWSKPVDETVSRGRR
ncbi:MAG TPA: hypothetical protein DEW39_12845 [Brevibacterium sp.]|nr:hypothetical protein [Brevibacterium sp.]